jgi:prepilin-type N-terminal cleavage/methylation domain-containing protein
VLDFKDVAIELQKGGDTEMMKLHSKKGFTLIELMIVVAIINILAAIAIPQFASLVSKSQEGRTKANLGTIRSALSIYYGDTEGWYPVDVTALSSLTLSSKYLQAVPTADLPVTTNNTGHSAIAGVTNTPDSDGGGWYYNRTNGGGNWGQILVSCVHRDIRGSFWTSY